ncbi:hypothetical protein [Stenotrophomonas sp. YIM B13575]
MTHYRKPPLSIQAQLDQLQQRGLALGDAASANRYLQLARASQTSGRHHR